MAWFPERAALEASWRYFDRSAAIDPPSGRDFRSGQESGAFAATASRVVQEAGGERASTVDVSLNVDALSATSRSGSASRLTLFASETGCSAAPPGAAFDDAPMQPERSDVGEAAWLAAPEGATVEDGAPENGGVLEGGAGDAAREGATDDPGTLMEEPSATVETIELALILDASLFAARPWVALDGGPVDFAGYRADDAASVLDAQIAAYAHLLTDLAIRIRNAEAADPFLEVELDGLAVVHGGRGAPRLLAFDLDRVTGAESDAEIDAIVREALIERLEAVGAAGLQQWGEAVEAAADFFDDTRPEAVADADGADRFLFKITDSARGRLPSGALAAVDAVDGLVREVRFAPHETRVWSAETSGLAALDTLGDGPEAFSSADALSLPELDFL